MAFELKNVRTAVNAEECELFTYGYYKIKIDDRHPQKQEILRILRETDWKNEVKGIAMARLKQYMIFKKLRECGIEELKIKEENIRQICADNEE